MGRRTPAVIAVLLLAAVPASGDWIQAGGDDGRSGVSELGRDSLDVQRIIALPDGIQVGGAGILDGGDGFWYAALDGCAIVRLDPEGGAALPVLSEECESARLLGRVGSDFVVCLQGADEPLVRITRDGTAVWSTGPGQPEQDLVGGTLETVTGLLIPPVWTCPDAVVTPSQVIAVFDAPTAHVITAYSHGGEEQWSAAASPTAFRPLINGTIDQAIDPAVALVAQFHPESILVTDSGIVTGGRFGDDLGLQSDPALAWLTVAGEPHGVYVPVSDVAASQSLDVRSVRPAAFGVRAATFLGEDLVVVDPSRSQAAPTSLGNPSFGAELLAAPAWGASGLVVPSEAAAFVIEADPVEPGHWGGSGGARVQDVILDAAGDAIALVTAGPPDAPSADLVRFTVPEAETIHRVPLPIPVADPLELTARLSPVDGGLIAWTIEGAVFLAHDPTPGPGFDLDSQYPPVGGELLLTTDDPPANETWIIAWGDGAVEELSQGRNLHVYRDAGVHTIRLTRILADGTSETTSREVYVGGTEPQAPSWLETIFSPDNQELTFTVIGFGVSAIGVLIGVLAATRGRRRLDKELKALEQIREHGRRETLDAVHELHVYKMRIRDRLANGKLTDGQYAILSNHVGEVLDVLRERILGGFVTKLSRSFVRMFDLALRDGRIDPDEAHALLELAEQDGLPDGERERLGRLLSVWQAADSR